MIKQPNQSGFTIVELMIATTVLSVLLVLIATVSVQIGKLFYKGVSISRTQETVRNVSDLITRNIQYAATIPALDHVPASDNGKLCVGTTRYIYKIGVQASTANKALWTDQGGGTCTGPIVGGKELLPRGMRLVRFEITPPASIDSKYWVVDISVALGDDDVLNGGTQCKSSAEGGQYCDVASLKTGVYQWK